MNKKYIKWLIFLLIFIFLSVVSILYSLGVGEYDISLLRAFDILKNQPESDEFMILTQIRLPRILLGFSVGGALSLAGVLLQGIYRNPLVEPYTLGISGGAALSIAFVIVFGVHHLVSIYILPLAGFLGAVATIVLLYFLSLRKGKMMIKNMLLIGVMLSFICSSATMLLMAMSSADTVHSIVFWMMGSLDEPNLILVKLAVIVSLCGLMVSILFISPLNALRLGEEKARYLGINTDVLIKILFLIASLLTGIAVAVAGVIGFVGLVIPHLIRILVGNDYRIFLPLSYFAGGVFIVFSDTLARTIIAPNELPVGVITGIIGGLLFIGVLLNYSLKN